VRQLPDMPGHDDAADLILVMGKSIRIDSCRRIEWKTNFDWAQYALTA